MKQQKAFTLIELLVVVAIIALLISILLPSLSRAREASKRVVCAQNLKGISTASKTYAHDHNGSWPTVANWPFDSNVPNTGNLESMGGTNALPRDRESRMLNEPAMYQNVSPTRAMWLLIRQRQINSKSFICPSSNEDQVEQEEETSSFYDFKGYGYMSYGYQISTMQRWNSAVPRENRDPRMVFLADKNPGVTRGEDFAVESDTNPPPVIQGYVSEVTDNFVPMKNQLNDPPYSDPPWNGLLDIDMAPELFLKFNSPNHGGRGEGEGQNVSRADGSAEFFKTPLAGVDNDNIYSSQHAIPLNPWSLENNVYTGYWPGRSSASTTPGFECLPSQSGGGVRSGTTDTMVFP